MTLSMAVGPKAMSPALSVVLGLIAFLVVPVLGDCECGYTANINATTPGTFLFTDVLESDFLHIKDATKDTDWARQNFTKTAAVGRGQYGMNYTLEMTASNPIVDHQNWTGPGSLGGDPGLQLTVEGGIPADGYVKIAELDSTRNDLSWGTYRAAMKLSPVKGTCAAFFWYFNDSQEIDMEFLTAQFNAANNSFPVNLVLQSADSVKNGFNAVDSKTYAVVNLPFNPTTAYHEYRFDYVPGNIIFYADGTQLTRFETTMTAFSPGHLILTHWSNGNPLWSAGPPASNATMSVSYVKSYFNSTSTARQGSWAKRCTDPSKAGAICAIADQKTAPDPAAAAASTYFFSDNSNQIANQTVFKKSAGSRMDVSSLSTSVWMLMGASLTTMLIV